MQQERSPKQQIIDLIGKSQSILVVTHENPDGDALGSLLAMGMALRTLGKQVITAVTGEDQQSLAFLPEYSTMQRSLQLQKDLLIVLDESQAPVGNITLKRLSDTKLVVVVSPKEGELSAQNVRIEDGSYQCDLIICLDCVSLDRLGSLYADHTNLFYEVPIINIDHHSSNNHFGTLNLVDLAASATCEMLVSLIEGLGSAHATPLITADMATCLLTGITTDTGSFQNGNTTPKSLTVAAQLIAAGAEQQRIIQEIFKTKQLSTLRLWGRALSYLKEDADHLFVWSTLSKADFVAAQAKGLESSGVIDELLKTAQGMRFVMLMSERGNGVHVSLRSIDTTMNVALLAESFGGGGHPRAAAFFVEQTALRDAEGEIIRRVRSFFTGDQAPMQPMQAPQVQVQNTPEPVKAPVEVRSPTQATTSPLPTPPNLPRPLPSQRPQRTPKPTIRFAAVDENETPSRPA
jgi:bifunctional oligoribonuclease and PAP phosphatase NrnA